MTILRIDGFDMYDGTNSTITQRGWSIGGGGPSYNVTGRFTGSKAMKLSNANQTATAPHGSAISTVSVGFAFNNLSVFGAYAAGGSDILRFTNAGTAIAKLGMTNTGQLIIGRADYTTNKIADSGAFTMGSVATWYYIEVEFTRSATVGVFKVYVNGALVINSTGVNTGASDVDGSQLVAAPSNDAGYDDFYLTNTSTRLGERRVEYIVPSADTAQKDWGTSSGTTHFSLINEVPNNGDSNYLVDSVVGHKDTFDLTDLSSTPATIDAVQVVLIARKDDVTTRQIRNYNKSGATTTNGTTQAMGSNYLTFTDTYFTDPNTAAAWTASAVNALQLGLEVVT